MGNKLNAELYQRLEKLIQAMHFELWGCELISQGRHAILRIYIDSPKGVTIDHCTEVSQQVGAMLDVEDAIAGRYSLEVSSPGLNRLLFKPEHYQKWLGSYIKVKLIDAINNRRQFKGYLKNTSAEGIYITIDITGEEIFIPFNMVDKANVIYLPNVRSYHE